MLLGEYFGIVPVINNALKNSTQLKVRLKQDLQLILGEPEIIIYFVIVFYKLQIFLIGGGLANLKPP